MFVLRQMRISDLDQVMVVNKRCFTIPWPERVFRIELGSSSFSHWVVLETNPPEHKSRGLLSFLRRREQQQVIGFGGFWLINGEAHISNIGVDPQYQGRGLGELLLVTMMKRAMQLNASWTSLEVRISNDPAIRLYEKYNYQVAGRKKSYYHDNGEDAYLMNLRPLNNNLWSLLDRNMAQLAARLKWEDYFLSAEEL